MSPKRRHNFKKGSILDEQGLRSQTQKSLNIGICWYCTTPLKHPMMKFVISRSPVQIRPSAPEENAYPQEIAGFTFLCTYRYRLQLLNRYPDTWVAKT
ncbi:MAG TPA: hypothetical protein DD791_12705 [Syntrophomonas sp.]|nr:hypothetical protein [Syntrophomonas sp.]